MEGLKYARIMLAVVWIPPELLNISNIIPNKKLAINNPDLLPFTGYKMINRI
jgi:hypothetical protein